MLGGEDEEGGREGEVGGRAREVFIFCSLEQGGWREGLGEVLLGYGFEGQHTLVDFLFFDLGVVAVGERTEWV